MKRLLIITILYLLINNFANAECIKGNCDDGYGTYSWGTKETSETIYEGEFKDGLMHGKGKLNWSNGGKYIGDFVKSRKTGQGKMIWKIGDVYEGGFLNDKYHGYGHMIWTFGEEYKGEWYESYKHGKGKYIYPNGSIYDGEWKYNLKEGYGIMTNTDGSHYEGYFLKDTKHGKGKYTFKKGDIYEGDYFEGNSHGKGTYYFNNGDIYEGDWVKGMRTGKGKYVWKDGSIYEGDWVKGDRIGKGKYIGSDGSIYEGDWFNDRKEGKGRAVQKNGYVYEGDFSFGSYHGTGSLIAPEWDYAAGGDYHGEWKYGQEHGKGILIYKEKYESKYIKGNSYEGDWINGEMHGTFIITKNNGKTITMNFDRNEAEDVWRLETFLKKEKKEKEILKTDEKYYALLIGNNKYDHLKHLKAASNDAKVLSKILKENYGFEVKLLINADYDKIVNSLYNLSRKLKKNDNLLIFYAGHGELDRKENEGYWLPVDASFELRSKWISNSTITNHIKATEAKHVLLIADSCYAGSLTRSGNEKINNELDEKYIEKLKNKKTRLVITSGGNKPVMDNSGGKHSVFSQILIDILKQNKKVISTASIFENLRKKVGQNAEEIPERSVIHKTGHDGGDFLFFPKS